MELHIYGGIVELLLKHLSPTRNKICKSIEFREWFQLKKESIQDCFSRLKKMTTQCSFSGDTLNEFFFEKFIEQ